MPVFSGTLESDLVGVLRCYTMLDPQSGQTVQVCEYWDDTTCRFYRQNGVSGSYTYFEYPEVGQELRHGSVRCRLSRSTTTPTGGATCRCTAT